MNRSRTLITAMVMAMFGCQTSDRQAPAGPPDSPDLPVGDDWGFIRFAEIRAYRINWNAEHSTDGLVRADGQLNPSRLPAAGIQLSGDQVDRLRQAVTGVHPPHPIARCFLPHHAFAFYHEDGHLAGHLDICFLCNSYQSKPEGFAPWWDLTSIASLFTDLTVPMSNPHW